VLEAQTAASDLPDSEGHLAHLVFSTLAMLGLIGNAFARARAARCRSADADLPFVPANSRSPAEQPEIIVVMARRNGAGSRAISDDSLEDRRGRSHGKKIEMFFKAASVPDLDRGSVALTLITPSENEQCRRGESKFHLPNWLVTRKYRRCANLGCAGPTLRVSHFHLLF